MALAAAASLAYGLRDGDAGAAGAAQAQPWHCPMHPDVVQDRPGSCPICGMDLVPVAEEPVPVEPGPAPVPGLAPVELSAERVQLIGMKTAPVARGAHAEDLRLPAWISLDEQGLTALHARAAGWIERLLVAERGREVRRGELLAELYSPELLAAQEEFLAAGRWATPEGGSSEVAQLRDDARQRLDLLGMAREDIDSVQAEGVARRAVPLRAPASGFLLERPPPEGSRVEAGTPLFQIADLSRVQILAEAPQAAAAELSPGRAGTLRVPSLPGEKIPVRLDLVQPRLDTASRALRVRATLSNPGRLLRPGMTGELLLPGNPGEGLWAPVEAVVETGESRYAFVDLGGGRFQPRRVLTGRRAGELVEVLSGVHEGESVVTSGIFLLDSESRVSAAVSASAAPAAEASPPGHSGHAGHAH
jgi:Cu(I)/Ag(I) efflux system membrane fusion protein